MTDKDAATLALMFDLLDEDVEQMTNEEARAELEAQGIDVDAATARFLERLCREGFERLCRKGLLKD